MNKYLEIARLTKTQGLKGELRAQTFCDDPEELSDYGTLYLGGKNEKTAVAIEYSRVGKGFSVIKLKGTDTIEAAQLLIGKSLYLDRDDIELPDGTYFIADLIGIDVLDADSGKRYGKIDEVSSHGAADVYSIKTDDGKQLLFPAIPDVLLNVDLEKRIMTIRPLEGLFDEG